MQSRLFVGGAYDGRNIPVADDLDFIQLPAGVTGRETYIRDTLAVGAYAFFTFYRYEKLTPEEVIDFLAKHYKAWAMSRPGIRP